MKRHRITRFASVTVAAAMLFATVSTVFATVSTDQPDYAPGSIVTINGDGMSADESVGVWVYLPDGSLAQYHEVQADGAGNFTDTYLLPPPEAPVVGTYSVVAFGFTSEATFTATFDDHTPVPTNLSATAVSGTEIDVTWTGIGAATGANHEYHLERCTGSPAQCVGSETHTAGSVGTNSWTSPASATGASDSVCATTTATSGVVGFWKNFGFAIPAGATIEGIQVAVKESKGATGAPITTKVNVGANEATLGTEKTGGSLSNALCTDAGNDTDNFGTASDTWGRTWTAAEINSSDFTVKLTTNAAVINRVDSIAVTVSWNEFGEIGTVPASGTYAYADTTVACATEYSYRTRLHDHDSSLFSAYSNVDSDTTSACVPLNNPPVVTADNDPVTVDEGSPASNTGTWSDADAADTVTLSASVGTVSQFGTNAGGTWSWSYTPVDGPADSQTVTITADDGTDQDTATFALVVNNVAPDVAAPSFSSTLVACGSTVDLTGISFDDPGTIDFPWGVNIDWGDGSTDTSYNTNLQGGQSDQSHPYTTPGTFTATVDVTDKDGGTGTNTSSNTVQIYQYTVKFLPPFDGSSPSKLIANTMKAGRVVPVKATIFDECAQEYVTDPDALVKIVLKDGGAGTPGTSDAIEVYADAGASNSQSLYFRWTSDATVPGGGFWIFNLDSKTVLGGNPLVVNHCYRIDIFVDGSTEADRATVTTWGLLKPLK
jgi:hypothetical protein